MASQCIMYAVWVPVLPPGARQVHDSFSDYYGDLLEGQYGCPDRIVLNGDSRNLLFRRADQLDDVYQAALDRTRAQLDVRKVTTVFGRRQRPATREAPEAKAASSPLASRPERTAAAAPLRHRPRRPRATQAGPRDWCGPFALPMQRSIRP